MAERLTYAEVNRYVSREIAKLEGAGRRLTYSENQRLEVLRGLWDAFKDKRDVPATNAAPRALHAATEPYSAPRPVHWNRAHLNIRSPWRARLEEEN